MQNCFPSHLPDAELVVQVERLAASARDATTRLVAYLAELDARGLYRGAGYSSLFAYCTERLRISEYGAYNRMEAARAARRFPVILGMLADGALTLATARILAPHLNDQNHAELLEAARGRSKREVEELVARHFPRPAVPALVRKLRVRAEPVVAAQANSAAALTTDTAARTDTVSPAVTASASSTVATADAIQEQPLLVLPEARPTITPLAPERYQIRFTASAETHQKLREAQELLGHAVPSGDVAAVMDRALTALIAELRRKKLAVTDRPGRTKAMSAGSRHIPAEVRRRVWQRDDGRCAFVAAGGVRCTARKPLEFHHVHPYGAGGEATVGNIELRCRSHNAYEAELFYGALHHGHATRPGAS